MSKMKVSSKYHLCSAEERNSFRFKTTLEWVNDGIKIKHLFIFIFIIPLILIKQREKSLTTLDLKTLIQ